MGSGTSRPGSRGLASLQAIQRMKRNTPSTLASVKTDKPEAVKVTEKNTTMPAKKDDCVNEGKEKGSSSKDTVSGTGIEVTVDQPQPSASNGASSSKEEETVLKSDDDTNEDDNEGDDKGDDGTEKGTVKKKPLTAEEIEEKRKKAFEKVRESIQSLVEIPPRNMEEEGTPFNLQFRQTLVAVTKSYFLLKVNRYPVDVVFNFRNAVSRVMCESGCIKLLCDVLSNSLKTRDFLSEEGTMIKGRWFPVKNILLALVNNTDCSEEVRLIICGHPSLLKELTRIVQEWRPLHLDKQLKEDQNKLIKWSLSIFHNCGMQEESVAILRDLDLINILLPYLDSHMEVIRLATLSTLADIVNEEEAVLLQTNPKYFAFIIKKLKRALKKVDHKDLGWSAEELMRALKGLARSDVNKKVLVEEGCLTPLVKGVNSGNSGEKDEALSCLWALSFDEENKMKMVSEPDLVDTVQHLYTEERGAISHSCQGILWSLREQLLKVDTHKHIGEEICKVQGETTIKAGVEPVTSPPGEQPVVTRGHAMMSYQWGHQELIKKIVHKLRSHGIPVWLDIDYMGGSTLQAMAKAVEDSFVVIIAMSQKYKDSPNTRAEAEYAFQQRKKIIPLVVQRGYRADGWLGLILGSKLFYDFSGKYSFDSRMSGLLKAVKLAGDGEDVVDGSPVIEKPLVTSTNHSLKTTPTTPQAPPLVPAIPRLNEAAIMKWEKSDIEKWLKPHEMERSSLIHLSGEEIIFLHNLKYEAPEYFYQCLEKKLCLTSLLHLARATKAFKDLAT